MQTVARRTLVVIGRVFSNTQKLHVHQLIRRWSKLPLEGALTTSRHEAECFKGGGAPGRCPRAVPKGGAQWQGRGRGQ